MIIGISGGSCGGKSTFSEKLGQRLGDYRVRMFHMDEYFRVSEERPQIVGAVNGRAYVDDNHPDTLDMERFHRDLDQAVQESYDVILVEGIFALWDPQLYEILDLKIYVDCDSEERLVRRVRRHQAWGEAFDDITDRYLHAVRPRFQEYVEPGKWKADVIVNGFTMPETGLEMVLNWIISRL